MYLENSNIIQILRTTELSEGHINQTASYFIYFVKDAEKIANVFLEEIKICDNKIELVIMFIISEMIKFSMAESNIFILAFGKNLLELTNCVIKKGDKNSILNLIQLFEFWNNQGIYNQNLSERCLSILKKKLYQIQKTNKQLENEGIHNNEEYQKLQKNISIILSQDKTKRIFNLRQEHSIIKNRVSKLKNKIEFISTSNIGQTQKEIQTKEVLQKLEKEKKSFLNLFLSANSFLLEFN